MKFDRPLATGSLSAEAAAALIAGTLIAAVMGSTVFGISGVLLTVALAGGALVYNAAARFVPAIGLPLIAGLYAGHLLVPSPQIAFLWPVWLVFTHVLVVRLAAHALGRRMPRLSARGGVLLLIAWLGGSAALAALSVARNGGTPEGVWPGSLSPSAAIAPAVLLLLFGLAVWRVAVKRGPGARAEDRSLRYGSLWMPLYNAAWLFGAGHEREGLVMLGIAAAGPIAIGLVRELYGLVEHPLGYRL
jgi:hypothetical protein